MGLLAHVKFAGGAGNPNGGTSSAVDSTGATLGVIFVPFYTGGTFGAPTDSKGNSWAAGTPQGGGGDFAGVFYYSILDPAKVGSGHTVTVGGVGAYEAALVAFFDGSWTFSGLENGAATHGTPATFQTGAITPLENGHLILAAQSSGSTALATIDSGFSIIEESAYGSPNNGMTLAYLVQANAALINPTFSNLAYGGAGVSCAAVIISFKPGGTSVSASGLSATASIGTPTVNKDDNFSVSGLAATASIGSVALIIGPQVFPAGLQADASIGAPAVTVTSNVSVSGLAATASIGTPRTLSALAITNQPIALYQRVGTAKTITFSGTYSGSSAPPSIEVKVDVVGGANLVAYTALSSFSAAAGAWSGTLSVPQGAYYRATARDAQTGFASAQQSASWSVGARVAWIGQSLNVRMASQSLSGQTADPYLMRTNGSGWTAPTAGGGQVAFGNAMRAAMVAIDPTDTTPIGFLEYAIDGTSIVSWQTGQSSWSAFVDGTSGVNAASIGPDFEVAFWHQLYGDAFGTQHPEDYYAADLANLLAQLLALTGRSISTFKLGIALVGTEFLGTAPINVDFDLIMGYLYAQSAQPGCFFAGSTRDMLPNPGDNGHWLASQYPRAGKRYANAYLKALGLASYGSLGPAISAASWPVGSSTITVRVSHNSGGTTLLDGTGSASGSGLEGFVVAASGGQTVSGIALSAGQIVITMSAPRGVGETVTLKYNIGTNPWEWVDDGSATDDDLIYDNRSAYVGDTTGFPLLPTTATHSATSGAVTVSESAGTGGSYLSFARRRGRR